MATVGRKNLKEQASEPVPVEENSAEDESIEEAVSVESENKETNQALKAITHILYNGRMYLPQEELPVDNAEMIEAWLNAGTAIWE
jgi:hypothetical protein|nr:MAG TPA: hypothetical protein [Caudoviricetes sp.]